VRFEVDARLLAKASARHRALNPRTGPRPPRRATRNLLPPSRIAILPRFMLRHRDFWRTIVLGAAGAIATIPACTGPATPQVSARDRAIAASESSKAALQNSGGTGPVSGNATSLGQAQETAANRSRMRRAVLAARKEQDETFEHRADDESFVNLYKTDDRNDSVKLYLFGRALGKLNKIDDAAIEFEASALADPKNPWPYEGLGICYFMNKAPDRAIAQLKKSIDVDPDLSESRFMLARALESVGRDEEAITEAELVSRHDEDSARGPLLVAELHMKRNQPEKACAALAPAVQKSPDHLQLRLAYADALARNGAPEDASAQLDAAIAKSKIPPDRMMRYAKLYERADRFDRALELVQRMLDEAPPEYWRSTDRNEVESYKKVLEREKQLGYRTEYSVGEFLQMLARHPDVKKRQMAFEALRRFPFPEVDAALVNALKDSSWQIRALVIPEIEKRAGEGASAVFCQIARFDADSRVKATACRSLASMDNENAEKALVDRLCDAEPMVREAASAALETMTGRILCPGGIESLDDAGRKELQASWQRLLQERRAAKASGGTKTNNNNNKTNINSGAPTKDGGGKK
jgi:tetratricopeptide (TPR) repeat protein